MRLPLLSNRDSHGIYRQIKVVPLRRLDRFLLLLSLLPIFVVVVVVRLILLCLVIVIEIVIMFLHYRILHRPGISSLSTFLISSLFV